jgi:peroxiredoxin
MDRLKLGTARNDAKVQDSQGRFVFDKVPPVEIVLHDYAGATSRGTLFFCGLQMLIVGAGETIRLELPTEKRTVIGHLAVPEGLTIGPAFGFSPDVEWDKLNRPRVPKEFDTAEKRAEWLRAWWKTDTGHQRVSAVLRYRWPQVNSDGSFVAEMVEPGRYWVNGSISQNGKLMAKLNEHLEVTAAEADAGDSPFDVGKLAYKPVKDLKDGDAAPDFSATLLDNTPVRLSDFRGKYVLLDFWATWCGPCVAELPNLSATYDTSGKDARFVMMSLSVDSDREAPRKFVRSHGTRWEQVFLGKWSEDKVTEAYGITGIPEILLIGPDGRILGHGLRGNKIKEVVAAALHP